MMWSRAEMLFGDAWKGLRAEFMLGMNAEVRLLWVSLVSDVERWLGRWLPEHTSSGCAEGVGPGLLVRRVRVEPVLLSMSLSGAAHKSEL